VKKRSANMHGMGEKERDNKIDRAEGNKSTEKNIVAQICGKHFKEVSRTVGDVVFEL